MLPSRSECQKMRFYDLCFLIDEILREFVGLLVRNPGEYIIKAHIWKAKKMICIKKMYKSRGVKTLRFSTYKCFQRIKNRKIEDTEGTEHCT